MGDFGEAIQRSHYEQLPPHPPVNHPIVGLLWDAYCGAPCNFNDPSARADFLIHFSSATSFYLVPNTPTCLHCDQYAVSWNEAMAFNVILRDQIAAFDPPLRCV